MSHDDLPARTIVPVLCAALLSVSNGQPLRLALEGGVSVTVNDKSVNWDPGLSLGAAGLFYLLESIAVGARVAYHRWPPAKNGSVNIDGSASALEMTPLARIASSNRVGPVGIFGQVALGLLVMSQDAVAAGSSGREPAIVDDADYRFGMSLGGGLSLGNRLRIELMPLYHVMFRTDGSRQFVTMDLAVSTGL